MLEVGNCKGALAPCTPFEILSLKALRETREGKKGNTLSPLALLLLVKQKSYSRGLHGKGFDPNRVK